MEFADLGLSPDTLKAVADAGYLTPTPIQVQAIPVVLMGRDLLGVAQTGTGKTAAFTMPMIDILADGRSKARMPRSLIIAPTRELAAQISDNFVKYGKYHPLSMALLIGGESFTDQEKALDRGVDVLIATPGRLLDLYERGRILLNDVKILVIDEADRMLDMGFIPDVERIVGLLPKIRQTLFFSATMGNEIRKLADQFLMNPKEIAVTPAASAAITVEQGLVTVRTLDKREALRRILRSKNVHNAFIFCNRKKDVDILFKSLDQHGFSVIALHGDMPQSKRNDMLAKFKANEAELLVCSDVAARGLDVSDVSHVINFDVPVNAEDYIHRIGRTGRAGKTGHAYTLATPGDSRLLAAVEKMLNHPIPPLSVPELADMTVSSDAADEGGRGRGRGARPPRGGAKGRESGRGRGHESGRGSGGRGRETPIQSNPPEITIAEPAEAAAPAFVAAETIVEAQEAGLEISAPVVGNQEPSNERKDRGPRKDRARHDRHSDARGAEDRARKTRRNPHGIAEMEIADNVIAFGGFTPAFLLVDPYGGKGPPPEAPTPEEGFDEPAAGNHDSTTDERHENVLEYAPENAPSARSAAADSPH
ncbi:MAG: DEAD/DEAH box helicase [Rhodospirillaceae bacterium]|nr:DEAD/DEAH box helicase [Rhodospirillaceae bacterium]